MSKVTTIGLDIAKNVFQVHGVDETGQVVLQRRLRRGQVEPFFAKLAPALIGVEACGSAHHWGRVLTGLGHEVRLMPPAYVKPYVKRNKTDGRDAEAICEAVTRPSMRFVAIKSVEARAVGSLHRARDLLVRQRTMLANALRGMLAEFGVIAAQGHKGLTELMQRVKQAPIPEAARVAAAVMARQWKELDGEVDALERRIVRAADQRERDRRGGGRSACIPLRPRVCCLAWAQPAAEQQRRQTALRRHQQTGQPQRPPLAHPRSVSAHAPSACPQR